MPKKSFPNPPAPEGPAEPFVFEPSPNYPVDMDMAALTPPVHGFVRLPKRVLLHPELGFSDKVLYSVLAAHADNKTGICWPSARLLMSEAGISKRRTFFNCMQRLAAVGVVQVMDRPGYTCVYRLPDLDTTDPDRS